MLEQRSNNRLSVKLPSRLSAITPSGKTKMYALETRDLSVDGAFLNTKEPLSFPIGTRFTLDLTFPNGGNEELESLKRLMECTGTLVRSSPEGIGIHFDRECEII